MNLIIHRSEDVIALIVHIESTDWVGVLDWTSQLRQFFIEMHNCRLKGLYLLHLIRILRLSPFLELFCLDYNASFQDFVVPI